MSIRCPDCPLDATMRTLYQHSQHCRACHGSDRTTAAQSAKRQATLRSIQDLHDSNAANEQQTADAAATAFAEQQQLIKTFETFLVQRFAIHDGTMLTEFRMKESARLFVRTAMIDEALGAARKLVGEVMKITPSVKPAELTALIGRLNDAVQAPGLADAASMRDDLYASAYVSPVERVLVEYDETLPTGRVVRRQAKTVEFPLLGLLRRFFRWDPDTYVEVAASMERIHHNAIKRAKGEEVTQRDIIDGMVVASEPLTAEFLANVAQRHTSAPSSKVHVVGGVNDPMIMFFLHYVDGAKTTDMGGSSPDADAMVFSYTVCLSFHPRRRMMHHVMMLQAVTRHEDVARAGVQRLLGGGATGALVASDAAAKSSWHYAMCQLQEGVRMDIATPDQGLRRQQLIKGADIVHLAVCPAPDSPPFGSQHLPFGSQHSPFGSQHPPFGSQHPPFG